MLEGHVIDTIRLYMTAQEWLYSKYDLEKRSLNLTMNLRLGTDISGSIDN